MGNLGCGSALIHSRKDGAHSSRLIMYCSTSIRKPSPRWQFCNSTQSPVATPCCSSLRAAGSCPCPMEIMSTCFLRFLARSQMGPVGSAPIDNSAIVGTRSVASSHTALRSRGLESIYLLPSVQMMYDCTERSVRSSRMARTTSMRSKLSRRSWNSGMGILSGESWSYQAIHRLEVVSRAIDSGRSRSICTVRETAMQFIHTDSGSQLCGLGFSVFGSRAPPPLSRQPM
mmetsp:Transcript_17133/g.34758  ORF Transcript_17133/g.34758 Transcript_17133/m.34758 type:complete len:229 (-) Transcript_17133:381-1067(-)